ncbi:MAG: DUF1614 domain-containing protein, partial [Dehalococcoidia bacterium]
MPGRRRIREFVEFVEWFIVYDCQLSTDSCQLLRFNDMGCLGLFILLLILIPILLFLFFSQVITISFAKLGLSPEAAAVLLILSLVGSMINIPLSRRQISIEEPGSQRTSLPFIFYTPPKVRKQTLAINVGGAVIPICFSIYLLMTRAP